MLNRCHIYIFLPKLVKQPVGPNICSAPWQKAWRYTSHFEARYFVVRSWKWVFPSHSSVSGFLLSKISILSNSQVEMDIQETLRSELARVQISTESNWRFLLRLFRLEDRRASLSARNTFLTPKNLHLNFPSLVPFPSELLSTSLYIANTSISTQPSF